MPEPSEHEPGWVVTRIVAPVVVSVLSAVLLSLWAFVWRDDASDGSSQSDGPTATTDSKGHRIVEFRSPDPPQVSKAFEFTLRQVECGAGEVSENPNLDPAQAQGQFCIATLNARNTSNAATPVFLDTQLLIGEQQFPGAGVGGPGTLERSDAVFPGSGVGGTLVFDVPAGGQPTRLTLREVAFEAAEVTFMLIVR